MTHTYKNEPIVLFDALNTNNICHISCNVFSLYTFYKGTFAMFKRQNVKLRRIFKTISKVIL